jgi:hypothetical protein
MRDWRDWSDDFYCFANGGAVFVAIESIGPGGMNYSTLGNTLYASAFMIFAFYLVAHCFLP